MTLYCPECQTTYEGDEYDNCPEDGSRLFRLNSKEKKGDPLIGAVVDDRFKIDKLLGAGGMGAVYRGIQLSVNREVAIKVLRPELADRELMLERFFREAKVVSEMTHPNIVRLVEFGQDQERDLLYLVMELVRGTDLGDLLRRGRLRTNLALEVIYQICGGLTEPHARGIVHRDLKPENLIMMPISDGTLQIKVLDFGIARALESGGTQLTKTGMVCGTPSYMAPEQAQNDDMDGRTDLYALGVMLYEMLMGQPPFVGESSLQVLLNHIQRPAPNLIEVMPAGTVPKEVSELVTQLLAKTPQERPESARAVRDRIDQLRMKLNLNPVRLDLDDGDPFDAWLMPRLKASDSAGRQAAQSSGSDLPAGLDSLSTGETSAGQRHTGELENEETLVHNSEVSDQDRIAVAETLAGTPAASPAVGDDQLEGTQGPAPNRVSPKKGSTAVVSSAATPKSKSTPERVASHQVFTEENTAVRADSSGKSSKVVLIGAGLGFLITFGAVVALVVFVVVGGFDDEVDETDESQAASEEVIAAEEDKSDEEDKVSDDAAISDKAGEADDVELAISEADQRAEEAAAEGLDEAHEHLEEPDIDSASASREEEVAGDPVGRPSTDPGASAEPISDRPVSAEEPTPPPPSPEPEPDESADVQEDPPSVEEPPSQEQEAEADADDQDDGPSELERRLEGLRRD